MGQNSRANIAFLVILCYNYTLMLVEHSFHDAITEPIPIVESLLKKNEQDDTPRSLKILKSLSVAALTGSLGIGFGAAATLIVVNAPTFFENVEASQAFTPSNNEVSEIISGLSGMELRVDCNDDQMEEDSQDSNFTTYGQVRPYYLPTGYVSPPVMTVRESVCDAVLNYNPELTPDDVYSEAFLNQYGEATYYAESIGILLHEAEHNNQVHEEDAATCYSYQKLPGALEKLGMSKAAAITIAQGSSMTMAGRLKDNYLSDECREGGELDLAISDVYIGDTIFAKETVKDTGLPPLTQTNQLN